ncbi:MAG: hypothetical protein JO102_05195 [Elusimicrobia bacterium]|nr:hypothetical protein [Elusimicrobiota bacterium]
MLDPEALRTTFEETTERAELDAYLRRWSWAGFLGSWVWGLAHGAPIALFALLPGFNVVVPVILGIYGNRLAWESRPWDSLESFRAAQERWARNGAIFMLVLTAALAFYFSWRHHS